MTRLTIELPDKLAEEAEAGGLLDHGAIETMLRENQRRRGARRRRQNSAARAGPRCRR